MKKIIYLVFVILLTPIVCWSQDKINFVDVDKINENLVNLSENEDYESLISEINKIHENDSVYCSTLVTKSYYLLKLDKNDQAIQVTNKILAKGCPGEMFSSYLNKSLAYYNKDDYKKTIETVNEALTYYPKNYKLMYNKALAYEELGEVEEAVSIYKNIIRINPFYDVAHFRLANIAYTQNLMSQSLMGFLMYLYLNPDGENSFTVLSYVNTIFAKENENNTKVSISKDDSAFEEIDLIINQRIALDKQYKSGNKIEIGIVRIVKKL